MTQEFVGRRLCIATMHGKERAIANHLESTLGVRCEVPPKGSFDSDRFGTFSGDVERVGTPLEVARRKAEAAMRITGTDLAVASEGSFGPHPDAFMLAMGVELVLLVDRSLGLEVSAEDLSVETNFARREGTSIEEVQTFANRIGFPEHALVLTVGEPPIAVRSGITDREELIESVEELRSLAANHGLRWFVASDMRADRNPTRMRAIERAAARLAARIATPCPECGCPGFGRVDVLRGLPCALCGTPTELVRAIVNGCARCSARREMPREDGRIEVDPGQCPACNP